MLKFFKTAFALSGDRTAVPDAVDANGNVTYAQGYGFDYQRQKTDPAAKQIERDKMNQIFFDVTNAIAELQGQGVPDFITSALNGGTAYSYGQNAVVRYSGDLYVSLVAANTALPSDATKWALLPIPSRLQSALNTRATAGGTADAITASFTPAIAALPAAPGTLSLMVRAGSANATTTPTFSPDGLTAKTIVKGANQALVAGDIAGAGHWLRLDYDATLDKWVLLNPATGITAATSGSVQGAFKNLALSANGLGNTVSASFDEVVLGDGAGNRMRVGALSYSFPANGAGAWNGSTQVLDTGAWTANTWYYVWIIGTSGGTTASLVSLSPTAPTMPSGFTYKALLGVFRTDGSGNRYPLSFKQLGRSWQYVVAAGSNVAAVPVMASGTAGSTTAPTWVAVGTSAFAPPIASRIIGSVSASSTNGTAMAAPNNAFGAQSSLTNPAPAGANAIGTGGQSSAFNFLLESTNIYWAANTTSGALACLGFELNL